MNDTKCPSNHKCRECIIIDDDQCYGSAMKGEVLDAVKKH